MKVAILGRSKWEWGGGDVIVIQVDDRYFAQCEERDDDEEADEIKPELAMELLSSRPNIRLTNAGRAWMREQRDLWAKYETMETRRPLGQQSNGN
jgi:hypothetical protein